MTLEAPAHRQRRPLVDPVHFLDRAVAVLALEVPQVRLVAELHELGQLVHPLPLDRLAARFVLAEFLDRRKPRARDAVASHADLERRDDSRHRPLRPHVAVHAVDLQVRDVETMVERDGLLGSATRVLVIVDRAPLRGHRREILLIGVLSGCGRRLALARGLRIRALLRVQERRRIETRDRELEFAG